MTIVRQVAALRVLSGAPRNGTSACSTGHPLVRPDSSPTRFRLSTQGLFPVDYAFPLTAPSVQNQVRRRRRALAISQRELADRVDVSRQAIGAIEAGRQVPSTELGLRLAHALGCTVEELFRLVPPADVLARAAASAERPVLAPGTRVALGQVGGCWVAHPVLRGGASAADGVVVGACAPPESWGSVPGLGAPAVAVRPLVDLASLTGNVLVAGCAPLLGLAAHHLARRYADARLTWVQVGNERALALLAAGLVHMAGVHLPCDGAEIAETVRRAVPGRRLAVVNLTRWRQGFVVPAGNPLGIVSGEDLLRPGLRLARRERGSGADALAARLLAGHHAGRAALAGPQAASHGEVARLVRLRAAHAGIAAEGPALAEGLGFVPLTEERFDLATPADRLSDPPVSRVVEVLSHAAFRVEVAHLPGYDCSLAGKTGLVEAA